MVIGHALKSDTPTVVTSLTHLYYPIPVPVYDLTVDQTENFKLNNGPFVHNSKDLADALAGVVFGLSMRKDIWLNHGVSPVLAPSLNQHLVTRKEEDPDPRYLNRRIEHSRS